MFFLSYHSSLSLLLSLSSTPPHLSYPPSPLSLVFYTPSPLPHIFSLLLSILSSLSYSLSSVSCLLSLTLPLLSSPSPLYPVFSLLLSLSCLLPLLCILSSLSYSPFLISHMNSIVCCVCRGVIPPNI